MHSSNSNLSQLSTHAHSGQTHKHVYAGYLRCYSNVFLFSAKVLSASAIKKVISPYMVHRYRSHSNIQAGERQKLDTEILA